MLPQLTLVLGGAASGKSAFAERLSGLSKRPRCYIATAAVGDDEMATKIALHQARRGSGWKTIEALLDVIAAVSDIPAGQVVLLDCATMWLANHMDQSVDIPELLRALQACASPVIVVSNELGQGIVPENGMARRFRQAHGEMNQELAAGSDLVVMVTAGLPLALKGQLPKGAA